MSEIRIEAKKLGDALVQTGKDVFEAQLRAAFAASLHLVAHLVDKTDEMGITDLGVYKNSHHAEQLPTGARTYNDAPHSGIVEAGARPHFLPHEGIEALARWAMRKLGVSEKDSMSAAWAISHNIAAKGLKGRWVYRDSQDQAKLFFEQELTKELHEL